MAVMTAPPPSKTPPVRRHLGFARRSHWTRTIGLALGFAMLGTVLHQHGASIAAWAVSILYCFGFPHLAWWLARRSAEPLRTEERNLLCDHFFGGFTTALMAFNLLPSVLTLCLMCMDSMTGGGRRLMLRGLVLHAIGTAVGVALFGADWDPAPTLTIVIASVPLLLLQPITVSLTARAAIDKLQAQRIQLEYQGQRDGLSGLFNRAHWESLVHAEFERCRRGAQPATLVMADLDHFKRINDEHGHAAGDEAIRRFADTLRRELRLNDAAGRYGGEEFGLLLPGTSAAAACELIERLRSRLHQQPLLDGVVVTASFGAVDISADIASPSVWLRLADQMLYRAKHLGRDRVATLGDVDTITAPAAQTVPPLCLAALNDQAALSHLLAGFDNSHAALALFDPMDHLVLANAAFRTLYHVQPTARSFADILRHCHRHKLGPAIECQDIEDWLRMAESKRRSRPHRSFTVDMLDAALFRAHETSFSDGWILLTLHSLAIESVIEPADTEWMTTTTAPEMTFEN